MKIKVKLDKVTKLLRVKHLAYLTWSVLKLFVLKVFLQVLNKIY